MESEYTEINYLKFALKSNLLLFILMIIPTTILFIIEDAPYDLLIFFILVFELFFGALLITNIIHKISLAYNERITKIKKYELYDRIYN